MIISKRFSELYESTRTNHPSIMLISSDSVNIIEQEIESLQNIRSIIIWGFVLLYTLIVLHVFLLIGGSWEDKTADQVVQLLFQSSLLDTSDIRRALVMTALVIVVGTTLLHGSDG
jgi:predicted ferric reductase